MGQKVLWIFLLIVVLSSVDGQSGRRTTFADERRNTSDGYETSSGNQWHSQIPNQQSSGLNANEYNQQFSSGESRDGDRPNRRPFGSFDNIDKDKETDNSGDRPNKGFGNDRDRDRQSPLSSSGHSNNMESGYSQRPNQQQFGSDRDRNRPNQPTISNNRESEYNQRSNQQFGNNRDRDRPNQQSSSGHNNRESEYNQRPNQHSGNRDRDRPNQQSSSTNSNNRESEYTQKPNQQFGYNRDGPNQRPFGSFDNINNNGNRPNTQSSSNQRPNHQSEFSQRPNHQGNTGEFGTGDRPGGNIYAQRPPSMGSLAPEGSKPLCYGFFGCFSQSEPWTSKLRPVPGPLPPENNSATFYFYSRPTIEQRYLINVYPEFSLGDAKYDPRKPTVIIIHGFIQDGNELWMEDMKNAYLRHVDVNAIILDWGKGSRRLSYLQAAGNTRLIGSMISFLIKRLMESHGADPSTFHLIGHSLGAHVASYAGKEVPGLGRITALDPAQPGFEGFDKSVRLDKSDAQFVDVVHTNAKPFIPTLGLGMIKPYGHVDFYMNGGFDQPLCISPPKNAINNIKSILDLANLPVNWFSQTFFCDHARAYSYLIEAFNNTDCVFWGHKASLMSVAQGVANTLTQGLLAKYVALSSNCNKEDCIPMGFNTHQSQLRGSFVVTTNGQFPYCRSESGVPSQRGTNIDTSRNKNM